MKRKIYRFISFSVFLIVFITICFNGSLKTKQTDISWLQDSTNYQIRDRLIYMESEAFMVNLNPATLAVTLIRKDHPDDIVFISQPVFNRKKFNIYLTDQSILYPQDNFKITFSLDKKMLKMTFFSLKPQSIRWPSVLMKKDSTSLIWPHYEGNYIPLDDIDWLDFLKSREWDTTQNLYMPFWGIENGKQSLSYLLENPFHNSITFTEKKSNLQMDFTHTFLDNSDLSRPITFRMYLDYDASPIEPAKHFRQYLKEQNDFVTLQDKMKIAPSISRLIGASHAYIWDGRPITIADVKEEAWILLAKAIVKQSLSEQPTAGKQIIQTLLPEERNFEIISKQAVPYPYLQRDMVYALSKALRSPKLYNKSVWPLETLPVRHKSIAERILDGEDVLEYELVLLNSCLIYASFPEYLYEPSTWGNGVSTRMIDALTESGMDHFVLTCDGIENIDIRPNIASYAAKKGYAVGPYDGYDSIHDPDAPEWSTATFDRELFETGRIILENNTPKRGFMGIGYSLSPISVKPYFDERIAQNFQKVPFSYYFIDGDAFGIFYDDYHPGRIISASEDAAARVDRISTIFEQYKVPVGSEGGSYLFAGSLSVAEGVFFPVITGDPDMQINEMSRYFLGRSFPVDEPESYFLPALLKDKYVKLYSDPRFRLPLYEAVFHDSVIATSHYSAPSLKFTNIAETTALTEILYQVAPMYHFNLNYFEKIKAKIKPQFDVFKKTHSYSYKYALEEFDYLNKDRSVQRTQFGSLELIANFQQMNFAFKGITIPARSVLIIFTDSGESFVYHNPALAMKVDNKQNIPQLIKALSSTVWVEREQAALAISLLGVSAKKAVPIIIKTLYDKEWRVRAAAIKALANMEEASVPAIPALIEALKDEEWQVRRPAAYALVVLGNKAKAAIPVLIKALNDEEWQVQKPAALALGSIGPTARAAIPALKTKLNDPTFQVRIAVERALQEIK